MGMTFDKMCNIILNEAKEKEEKFANLVIGNSNPTFQPEDILRDPNDPTKGTKLYLAAPEEKRKGLAAGDPQSIRRQIRRINWIARKLIKKYQNNTTGISVEKLAQEISNLLEIYQTKVLGLQAIDKANTGYETRVIGNILLPPTKRTPQGKNVFIVPGMDPNATVADSTKKIAPKVSKEPRAPRGPRTDIPDDPNAPLQPRVMSAPLVSAEDLWAKFDRVMTAGEVHFDQHLRNIIMKHAEQGSTIPEIVKDERLTGYEPEEIRGVIKGLLKTDRLAKDPGTGKLEVKPEEEWLTSRLIKHANRDTEADPGEEATVDTDVEAEPTKTEIPPDVAAETTPTGPEDEEAERQEIPDGDARPGWYPDTDAKDEPTDGEPEEADEDEDEEDEVDDKDTPPEEGEEEDWWK
jgi:hypothetical protein